ncbi:MAG: 2-C-methyl-D-erythritol 4-phosphate cytidylyltransferase [Nitrospirota bacterium]|nr:2-C-methyl-D-erythritol 4-phosphate cytidylyltransferase [Nitrospirota bacterium]
MVPESSASPTAAVVVPAGGRGVRMGTAIAKQFLDLGGAPLLIHTLRALWRCPLVCQVVLVVPTAELDFTRRLLKDHALEQVSGPLAGGKTRLESVRNGMQAVSAGADVIAIHDAVRPFPDPVVLERAIRRAHQGVGVVVGRPASDTIKRVDATGRVLETPARGTLWQAFTPQVFPAKMIRAAYLAAPPDAVATDDAQLAEWHGQPVEMIEGSGESLKVTTPRDLITARAWLEAECP